MKSGQSIVEWVEQLNLLVETAAVMANNRTCQANRPRYTQQNINIAE